MGTHLSNITTQYSKFTDNQVLSKNQLNTFLDYFEDQDRLTRVSLIGVGINCGFEVSYTSNSITITQGVGITTDGDLLKLIDPSEEDKYVKGTLTYTHYRVFTDENGEYLPFKDLEESNGIKLVELLPNSNFLDATSIGGPSDTLKLDLKDYVVLLHLECYENEDTICDTLDCDNQGIEQLRNLRALLISKENAEILASKDSIFKNNDWLENIKKMGPLAVKKDIVNTINTKEQQDLRAIYDSITTDSSFTTELQSRLSILFNHFFDKNFRNIDDILTNGEGDFQYKYDFLKDLVATYNEIRELVLSIDSSCCPDILAFPKHLMLGALEYSSRIIPYRHLFYPSINGKEKITIKRITSLLNKAELLCTQFDSIVLINKETKITPSLVSPTLSKKTIPFYYDLNTDLLNHWNFDKYTQQIQNTILRYSAETDSPEFVKNPLEYCFEEKDFYRIEGVHGLPYREAFEKVDALRKNFGLNFDIKVLSINESIKDININDYLCQFEDLKVLLSAWQAEQSCVLEAMTIFFSGFSIIEPGENIKIQEFLDTELVKSRLESFVNDKETSEPSKTETAETPKSTEKDESKKGILIGETFFEEKPETKAIIEAFIVNEEKRKEEQAVLEKEAQKEKESLEKENEILKLLEGNGIEAFTEGVKFSPAVLEIPKTKNPVVENLSDKADTIGPIINKSFQANKGKSIPDIQVAIRAELRRDLNTADWNKVPTIKGFVENDVIDILTTGYVITERAPKTIFDITDSLIGEYSITIDTICKLVNNLRVTYQKTKLNDNLKSVLSLLINQLSTICCSSEKLEVLLKEINTRKERVLKEIQLSEFAKKHPGMHHFAGVPKGGTFIMAYAGNTIVEETTFPTTKLTVPFYINPIEGDLGNLVFSFAEISLNFEFIEQPKRDIGIKTIGLSTKKEVENDKKTDEKESSINEKLEAFNRKERPRSFPVYIGKNISETLNNFVEFLKDIFSNSQLKKSLKIEVNENLLTFIIVDEKIKPKENYIYFKNPEILKSREPLFFESNSVITNITSKNSVVADFALPYMCCSDCTPINFILPKEPVGLSLPVNFFCLSEIEETFEPFLFNVQPAGGIVKALVPEGVNGGIVQEVTTVDDVEVITYKFDPREVDSSVLRKAIRFTVNDQPTSTSITVYDELVLAISETVAHNENNTKATVSYKVSGANFSEAKYFWDLGDGRESNAVPNAVGEISFEYNLPVNEKNTIVPSLQAGFGPCISPFPLNEITFLEEIIENEFEIFEEEVCYDAEKEKNKEILFTTTPVDLTVIEKGTPTKGLSIDNKNKKITVSRALGFDSFEKIIEFTTKEDTLVTDSFKVFNKNEFADFEVIIKNTAIPFGTPAVEVGFNITGLTELEQRKYPFNWKFGDKTSTFEKPKNKGVDIVHSYNISKLKPGKVIFNVTLQIAETPCSLIEITHPVEFQILPKEEIVVEDDVIDTPLPTPTPSPKNCNEITKAAIQSDFAILNPEIATSKENKEKVVTPTITIYNLVIKSIDSYVQGANNGTIDTDFGNLISTTLETIQANKEKPKVLTLLCNHLKLQIQLFYNILRCQDNIVFEEVLPQVQFIKTALNWLKKNAPDKLEKFSSYIISLSEDETVSKALKAHINNEIRPIFEK